MNEVKDYFEKCKCKLVSTDYINSDHKLDYICACGNPSSITFHNFRAGYRCKACGYHRLSNLLNGRIFSESTKQKMKKSHWANQKDYSSKKHPRFGTIYPVSWTKGLTADNDGRLRSYGEKISLIKKGKKLSQVHKEKIKIGTLKAFQREEVRANYKKGMKFRGVHRYRYGESFYRSTWEVEFAKNMTESNIKFDYEPKVFELFYDYHKHFYLPDFFLPDYSIYIEIKGYMDEKCRKKLEAFSQENKLIILDSLEKIKNYKGGHKNEQSHG